MSTIIIKPVRNLIDEIILYLKSEGKDYSSNLVVFPGKRPSHFLRKAIAKQIKGSFIPPHIFSMDEFVDYVFEGIQPKRKIETIDAVAILYEIQLKAPSPIGHDSFLKPDNFFPVGLKVYRDLEELYIEGIKPGMVKNIEPYTDEVIPGLALHRLRSLSCFYEEFYKAIEERGLSTRSYRYREAAERIGEAGLDSYEQIIFAGFYALTKYEKDLFRKLRDSDNTSFIFVDGPGLKEKLADSGIRADKADKYEDDSSGTDIHFYSSPDTHGQVYALSEVLTSKLKGGESPDENPSTIPVDKGGEWGVLDEKTAIVLPSSETLFPLLRQGVPIFKKDSYNISLGYPLHRTPVFGFLNNLMELITTMDGDRVYIPDYLKFVLHPYTKNIFYLRNPEITRIMFHTIEERLTQNKTKTFLTLREIEEDETLSGYILEKIPEAEQKISRGRLREHLKAIHSSTIEKFLSFENIGDFSGKCRNLLTYIFNNSTARLHPLFYPFSESFLRAMDSVSVSLMKDFAFTETGSYFTFFRKYIMTIYSPFEGTPLRGLQILGFLETRNIRFERVFILDANEETLPDTRKDDSLLPFKARQILGLPTYVERDRLAAYYFETLLKGAREVHLFFIENDRKERSRFVERLIWEKQKMDRTTDTKKYLRSVQYRVRLDNPVPQEITKTDSMVKFLKDFTYSATALDTYLACPLRFYYSYVLGLGKKEEVSGEIERVDTGKFVHKAMSSYFSGRKNRALKEGDINVQEMGLLVDDLFEKAYGKNPAGALYLLKMQIKDHLKDFLEKYFLRMIKEHPLTVIDIERDIRISINGFRLKGRIDSIEKRGKKTFIVDYKTGSNPDRLKIDFDKLDPDVRGSWDEAIGSIQLPFYLLLYSEKTGMRIKDLDGMFLMLGQTGITDNMELRLFGERDEDKAFDMMKTVIIRLLGEITDPSVPFKPSSEKKLSCPDCDFRYICGTQWIVK